SLYDLYVIACRIFRRKQTEKGTGRTADAVDVAFVAASIGIGVKNDRLSRSDFPKLCLFEISGDPHVLERNLCQQLLAGLNIHPDHDGFSYLPSHGGDDFCVAKVQLRLLESGAFLLNRTFRGLRPCACRSNLAWGGLCGTVTCLSGRHCIAG